MKFSIPIVLYLQFSPHVGVERQGNKLTNASE